MSKIVVITGGSAGIGAATAVRLVARGDRVVLAARDRERLDGLVSRLGGAAMAVVTDVTRRADVEGLRDQAVSTFGHIDVWINNAGRGITRPVLELTDEDVTKIISSFLARVPLASFRSVYSAAKAAVNSLTTNVRMDLATSAPGVHVSLVMPGIVATEFARNARSSAGTPVGPPPGGTMRPQTADEVAEAITRVIDRPVAETYTNPASPDIARRYFDELGAFAPLPA